MQENTLPLVHKIIHKIIHNKNKDSHKVSKLRDHQKLSQVAYHKKRSQVFQESTNDPSLEP